MGKHKSGLCSATVALCFLFLAAQSRFHAHFYFERVVAGKSANLEKCRAEKCRQSNGTIASWADSQCVCLCRRFHVYYECDRDFKWYSSESIKRARFSLFRKQTKSSHIFGRIYACQWHKQWCHFRHWNTDSIQIDSAGSCATDLVSFNDVIVAHTSESIEYHHWRSSSWRCFYSAHMFHEIPLDGNGRTKDCASEQNTNSF